MARNYKRDRNGKFAKVAGGLSPKGRKKRKAAKARANAKLSPQKRAANKRATQARREKIGRNVGRGIGIALAVGVVAGGRSSAKRKGGTTAVSTNQNAGPAVSKLSSPKAFQAPGRGSGGGVYMAKLNGMQMKAGVQNKRISRAIAPSPSPFSAAATARRSKASASGASVRKGADALSYRRSAAGVKTNKQLKTYQRKYKARQSGFNIKSGYMLRDGL